MGGGDGIVKWIYQIMDTLAYQKINRLSVIVAVILIAFGVSVLIPATVFQLNIQIFSIAYSFPINLVFISNLLTALLAATGMVWFLQLHPNLGADSTLLQHALTPGVTAFILNTTLHSVQVGASWWALFFFGGVVLFFVIMAEYSVIDPMDIWYAAATIGLLSLTYLLFLILLLSLSHTGQRLFVLVLTILPISVFVGLRAFQLRFGKWMVYWGVGVGILTTQIAVAFHYWPLNPVQYSLLITGVLFSAIELSQNLIDGIDIRKAMIGPAIGLLFFVFVGVLL